MIAFDYIRSLFKRKPCTTKIRYREPVQAIVDAILNGEYTIHYSETPFRLRQDTKYFIKLMDVKGGAINLERALNIYTGDHDSEIFLYHSDALWMSDSDARIIFFYAQQQYESEAR